MFSYYSGRGRKMRVGDRSIPRDMGSKRNTRLPRPERNRRWPGKSAPEARSDFRMVVSGRYQKSVLSGKKKEKKYSCTFIQECVTIVLLKFILERERTLLNMHCTYLHNFYFNFETNRYIVRIRIFWISHFPGNIFRKISTIRLSGDGGGPRPFLIRALIC